MITKCATPKAPQLSLSDSSYGRSQGDRSKGKEKNKEENLPKMDFNEKAKQNKTKMAAETVLAIMNCWFGVLSRNLNVQSQVLNFQEKSCFTKEPGKED